MNSLRRTRPSGRGTGRGAMTKRWNPHASAPDPYRPLPRHTPAHRTPAQPHRVDQKPRHTESTRRDGSKSGAAQGPPRRAIHITQTTEKTETLAEKSGLVLQYSAGADAADPPATTTTRGTSRAAGAPAEGRLTAAPNDLQLDRPAAATADRRARSVQTGVTAPSRSAHR